MRDLPGFFYDEDKGKYFPIHLKEAYEKEKEALKREKEKKQIEESQKRTDLYKFIGRPSLKFDSVSERISRIKVNEIIWSSKLLQINPENGFYYRFNWQNGYGCIEHMELSTGKEVKTVPLEFGKGLLKFGVIHAPGHGDGSKCFTYFLFQLESDGDLNLNISSPGGKVYSTTGPNQPYSNFEPVYCNGRLCFRSLKYYDYNHLEIRYLNEDGDLLAADSKIIPDSLDFLKLFPETGLIQVHRGGILKFDNNVRYLLNGSSAKWIHYHEGKLLVLTYHGKLSSLDLSTGEQDPLFEVKDFDLPERRFEDLIIDAKGKVVVIGYKNTTDIIFVNWIEKKVIKKLAHIKPIEQFKISSDLLNLYIHTLQ